MDRSGRVTRRQLLGGAGKAAAIGVAATAAGWVEIGNPLAASAAGTASSGEVGSVADGQSAYEYVGEVDQDGDSLVYYGYYTVMVGLGKQSLFSGAPFDETTSRFTYFGRAQLVGRQARNNVFVIDAVGTLQTYFHPNVGADFDHPATFHAGTAIAADDVKFHDVLSSTAPNFGVPNVTAFLERTHAPTFQLGGHSHRFGHVGMKARSTASGLGQKLDPKPKGHLTLAGQAFITG
ncbi:MAG TPA: hypothetical protein VNN79_11985 [Actinomycetota bacterium]|nr:hypothetical protein [Actinomycetota bacterium]